MKPQAAAGLMRMLGPALGKALNLAECSVAILKVLIILSPDLCSEVSWGREVSARAGERSAVGVPAFLSAHPHRECR